MAPCYFLFLADVDIPTQTWYKNPEVMHYEKHF